ncbi:type II toxin-antitoxin system RelE/ParE family toxin [Vulcanisaeta distributa]|uniref:type II toxin-antitoxin system RelE family toxin n=1 Tax=Vulcanisaeta distributa TaxID=164451 RepID=UPI000A5DC6BD|nr:type II toxin-antitoxin system RelE/ParE family toxin [Vulcanisaeta distributa]
MNQCRIEFTRKAKRELNNLPNETHNRLMTRLSELSTNPICEKPPLKGRLKGICRMRMGDYRIFYIILREPCTIKVLEVGKRENIYEALR